MLDLAELLTAAGAPMHHLPPAPRPAQSHLGAESSVASRQPLVPASFGLRERLGAAALFCRVLLQIK